MKKTFLKSLSVGIVGLTLASGCSIMNKESAHKCSSNTCKAKKEEAAKKETNSCKAKKEAPKKAAKKSSEK